jgi:mannose-6-phosphate isomerase-like protein (cupin superfamily)
MSQENTMKYSRRDLSLLLPALAATRAAGQTSALPSKIFRFEDLAVRSSGPNRMRAVLEGVTHAGVPIELHITELTPGEAPHPPHHHIHEEMILMLEGTVEVIIRDHSASIGPGSSAFVASNEQHGWRNVGNNAARYFVLALGRDSS